jgi:simple sugar transport system permease protein
MFSGLAGAFLTLGIAGTFNANMTAGDGFIALAAMVFGRYTPFGAAGACLLFGFGRALGFRLGGSAGIGVPQEFLNAIPYVLTLIILVALVGRSKAPAADGQPYEPGTE